MAFGTIRLIERLSPLDERSVLFVDLNRARRGRACREKQESEDHSSLDRRPFAGLHDAFFRSSRLRSWALRATTTVEALINTAATAGPRTIPAQASAPAARGRATTL